VVENVVAANGADVVRLLGELADEVSAVKSYARELCDPLKSDNQAQGLAETVREFAVDAVRSSLATDVSRMVEAMIETTVARGTEVADNTARRLDARISLAEQSLMTFLAAQRQVLMEEVGRVTAASSLSTESVVTEAALNGALTRAFQQWDSEAKREVAGAEERQRDALAELLSDSSAHHENMRRLLRTEVVETSRHDAEAGRMLLVSDVTKCVDDLLAVVRSDIEGMILRERDAAAHMTAAATAIEMERVMGGAIEAALQTHQSRTLHAVSQELQSSATEQVTRGAAASEKVYESMNALSSFVAGSNAELLAAVRRIAEDVSVLQSNGVE
jgi:hypothetical protein